MSDGRKTKFYKPKPPATQYGMTESQAKESIERLIREQQRLIDRRRSLSSHSTVN